MMRSVFGIKHLVTVILCTGLWIPSALWADCGDILFSNTTEFSLARGWKYQAQTNARQAGWNLASARGLGTLDGPGSNWRPVPGDLPVQYDDLGLQSLNADSAVWFRCKFILNGRAPDNRAIYLGLIQDTDAVYFNGSMIGETGRPGEEVDIEYPRIYSLPGHMFVDGENLITVRIQGASGNPGFVDTPAIVPEQQKVRSLIIRDIPRIVASSIYILVASFFLIFFVFFWHLRENLYFALFSFFLGLYNLIRTNLRYEYFDSFAFSWQVELTCLFVLPSLFLEYLHSLLRLQRSLAVKIIYIAYGLLLVATVIFGQNPSYWVALINTNLALLLAVLVLVGLIFRRHYRGNRERLKYLLYGFALTLPFLMWDMVNTLFYSGFTRLTVYGFLLFLGFISLQLSDSILLLHNSLRDQEKELRQLEKKKTRSIINISNEFNTIVSNLREGLAVMNANGSRPASKKVPITRIQSSVTSLENLIRDSNTLNLLEQGDYSVRRVNFSIRKLSEEVIQRVLAATMQPRKRLILELPPEDEEFAGDPDLIATALYHLLENALLYSLGQVELSVDRVPGRLEIAVRDEGPGLAIDQQEQIFQKFVRAAEDQDRIPGSGIGLAIVDMIARQLKGEIQLESGQGFFSTFTLRLPVSQT